VALLSVAVALVPLACQPRPTENAGRPGLVVVLVDDFDASMYGHLPELQAGGLVFENFVYSQSVCCPSRATILSGQHPWNHGVRSNTPPEGGWPMFRDDEPEALGVLLQRLGYRTGYLGKYLNHYADAAVPPGWDEWRADLHDTGRYRRRQTNENGAVRTAHGYSTDDIRRAALRFVARARADRAPFLLFLAPHAPHRPATPAARHAAAEFPGAEGLYLQKLRTMLAVVQLLSEVRAAAGPGAYTFFLSDNGFHYDPGAIGKGTPYSADSVVPLVAWGPDVAPGSTAALASNADLAPTLVELAGGRLGRDGLSLAPLLRGERPSVWRRYVPMWNTSSGWSVRSETRLYIEGGGVYEVGRGGRPDTPAADAATDLPAALARLKDCRGAACNGVP
jgi:arylsulfatase A-like enzyme